MKVRLTQEAKAGLERIGDHIAQDNPGRAGSFVRELLAACAALGDTPQAFPLVPRYEGSGIRRRTCGNYLVFYRVEPEQVVVLHILHGARDYLPLLFPGEA